jgi:hypothetical protein
MKARLPKSWDRLPQREKEIINQVMTEEVIRQVCHEQAELQKIWLQMACIVLHNNFGFGKKRCLLFLANWREMYRINTKLTSKEKQTDYLAREIEKIFGKGGYPKEYIDKLEEM